MNSTDRVFIMVLFVLLMIAIVFLNIAILGNRDDIMATCQLSHSFDVCHSTLNP